MLNFITGINARFRLVKGGSDLYRERYVSVEDLLDWLDDKFPAGENGVTDFDEPAKETTEE